MERTKQSKEIRWIKNGGGVFYLRRNNGKSRIIKPGERFMAALEDIPTAFLDTIRPLDGTSIQSLVDREDADLEITKAEYVLHHRGGGYYDVQDAKGKKINEGALRKEKAEELIASLS